MLMSCLSLGVGSRARVRQLHQIGLDVRAGHENANFPNF